MCVSITPGAARLPSPFFLLHCLLVCGACRQALGKYAGFQLGQRKQLQEVFDELGKPTEKRSAGEDPLVPDGRLPAGSRVLSLLRLQHLCAPVAGRT